MVKATIHSRKILIVALVVVALTAIVVYGFGIQNSLHDMMLSDMPMM
jgi:hypothetical protein